MSEHSEHYRLGTSAGATLSAPGIALRSALRQAAVSVREKHATLAGAALGADLLLSQKQERHARIQVELALRMDELDATEAERKRSPGRFLTSRGWLYFMGAVGVLIADAVFLTLVLTSVLGLPPFATSGRSIVGPVGAILSGDPRAMQAFVEVYLAATGLVFLAFAFKAWVDVYPRKEEVAARDSSTTWQRLRTPGGGVLLLICLTFFGVSASRLVLDYGKFGDLANFTGPEELTARVVAFLIGLAAFAGGAFLLMSSMDILALCRSLKRQKKNVKALQKAFERSLVALESAQIIAGREAQHADRGLYNLRLSAADAAVVDEFIRGYTEGVASTLQAAQGGGAYRTIQRTLAAAEASTSRRDFPLLPPA